MDHKFGSFAYNLADIYSLTPSAYEHKQNSVKSATSPYLDKRYNFNTCTAVLLISTSFNILVTVLSKFVQLVQSVIEIRKEKHVQYGDSFSKINSPLTFNLRMASTERLAK